MFLTLASLLVLLADPAQPQAVPDELLKKAAESDARMVRLYKDGAVTMSSRVEELNKDGKVEHTQEVVLRLTQKDGKPHGEVLRASRDGKDITEDERQKLAEQRARGEEGKDKRGRRMELSTPFSAESQPRYAFRLLGPDARDASLVRVGFGPRGKKAEDVWVGEAVVDPATGAVRWMKQRPSDLPAFVDRMEMVLEFGAVTSEGSAISAIQMEGEGGLPFFKKRFRVETKFSDYVPK